MRGALIFVLFIAVLTAPLLAQQEPTKAPEVMVRVPSFNKPYKAVSFSVRGVFATNSLLYAPFQGGCTLGTDAGGNPLRKCTVNTAEVKFWFISLADIRKDLNEAIGKIIVNQQLFGEVSRDFVITMIRREDVYIVSGVRRELIEKEHPIEILVDSDSGIPYVAPFGPAGRRIAELIANPDLTYKEAEARIPGLSGGVYMNRFVVNRKTFLVVGGSLFAKDWRLMNVDISWKDIAGRMFFERISGPAIVSLGSFRVRGRLEVEFYNYDLDE